MVLYSFISNLSRTKRTFRPSRMADNLSRFMSLDEPIDKFIEERKNKNTLFKTRGDVRLLIESLCAKSEGK